MSLNHQFRLLGVTRSWYYYKPVFRHESSEQIELKYKIKQEYIQHPFYGYRKISKALCSQGFPATPKQVRRLMREMGLRAIYPKPKLSKPGRGHKIYPYLLNGLKIEYINQVWASDITYIKLNGAFVYLVAILDLFSRKVLSWRLSNTADAIFCVEALNEAIELYGTPEIFNTDQGSQFSGEKFINSLEGGGIRVSMDGKGRALDNVYVERLWRSLKYENIFINDYQDLKALKGGVNLYFKFYNTERFHQALEYQTPDEVYFSSERQGFQSVGHAA